jgi:F5/8 type C domain
MHNSPYTRVHRRAARASSAMVVAAVAGAALLGSTLAAAPARAAAAGPAQSNVPAVSTPATSPATAPTTAPPTPAAPNSDLPAQLTASQQAKATGKPVPVTALTTQTTIVTADPNGSFTMTSSAEPVRILKNGAWTPIDTTLAANSDGTYSPLASALPLAFSGGGAANPMITITAPDSPAGRPESLAIYWPGTLPAPTVTGGTALYPDVLPGVDLRLEATGSSYSEVLIVHNAAAAADPALAELKLVAHSTNLTLARTAAGGLDATDSTGKTVFQGAAAQMWDSSINTRKGPTPSADDPGSGVVSTLGDALTPLAAPNQAKSAVGTGTAATSADTITLTPPAQALTGGGNKYPLYIDPTFGLGQNSWVDVDNAGGHWYNTSYSGDVEVGDCNWTGSDPCNPVALFRAYFQMNTVPLDGSTSNSTHATVTSASFTITQIWNGEAGCTATPVDLYSAGPISSSTTWPGPLNSYLSQASSGAGNGCGAAGISLNALSFAQTAAADWYPNTTFGLVAANEGTIDDWKQFDVNPVLSVNYAYPPNAATSLDVTGSIECNGTAYVNTEHPQLTAIATDNNSPKLNVNQTYTIAGQTGTDNNVPSGDKGAWTVVTALTPATAYTYNVAISNGILSAPSTSTSGSFTVLAPPPTAPAITSTDYPPGYWGQPTSTGGQLTVTSPDPNLQGFVYTLTGPGTEAAADSTTCDTTRVANQNSSGQLTDGFLPTLSGSAAVQIPAGLSVGYHTLNVKSVDFANNESPESATYTFYVSPATTVPSADLALHAAVTVSSTVSTAWAAANLTDGTLHATATDGGWSSAVHTTAASTESAEVTLGSAQTIDDVTLYPRDDSDYVGDGFPSAFTIATSTDNSTWTTVATEQTYPKPGDSPQMFTFPATTAQYVKVTATSLTDDQYGDYYFQLKQIGVYNSVTTNRLDTTDSALVTPGATGPGAGDWLQTSSIHTGWSSGEQVLFNGTAKGDQDTLQFNVSAEGDYAVGADMTQATDYGQVTFTLDGQTMTANGKPYFDGYRSACCSTDYVQLGGIHLTSGQHTLTMTMTGTNSASLANQYNAGVDYLTVAPVDSATVTSFAAAMNNHGITADNQASTADLDLTGPNALSSNALAAAGLTTTSPIVLDGDSFQLTPADSAGYDNVIALGQTIANPVPTSSPNKSIALLVADTCGPQTGGTVTVNYTNGTNSQAALGTIPDWATPVTGITPAIVLPTYDSGANATPTTGNRSLYTITVPTDPTKTIASITLPTFSTTMLPKSCSNALHVLAIGTHAASSTTTINGTAADWIGTWAAPADTTTGTAASPALNDQTVREIIHPSTLGTGTGAQIRIRLTVPPGASPAYFSEVTLAAQAAGSGPGTLAPPVPLTFGNAGSVTVNPGTEIYSDPITIPATSGGTGNLVVSMAVPGTAAIAPQHTGATTDGAGPPAYLAPGNAATDQAGSTATTWTSALPDWYYLEDADVTTTDTTAGSAQGTVVVLGDQTSLGAGANGQTWADGLLPALADTSGVVDTNPGGVVNLSTNGATTAGAISNLATTVEDEPNVRSVILDLGTNDLTSGLTYQTIETNLGTLVTDLSRLTYNGAEIHVYLATVLPDTTTAFTTAQEANREQVNDDVTQPPTVANVGYIDFDNTVTGCGTPDNSGGNTGTQITTLPTYLNGTIPNNSYYQQLAATAAVPVMGDLSIGPLTKRDDL